jgi:hypothetical protein
VTIALNGQMQLIHTVALALDVHRGDHKLLLVVGGQVDRIVLWCLDLKQMITAGTVNFFGH